MWLLFVPLSLCLLSISSIFLPFNVLTFRTEWLGSPYILKYKGMCLYHNSFTIKRRKKIVSILSSSFNQTTIWLCQMLHITKNNSVNVKISNSIDKFNYRFPQYVQQSCKSPLHAQKIYKTPMTGPTESPYILLQAVGVTVKAIYHQPLPLPAENFASIVINL